MQPETIKILTAIASVTVLGTAFFVFSCTKNDLTLVLIAVLVLAGKDVAEILHARGGK